MLKVNMRGRHQSSLVEDVTVSRYLEVGSDFSEEVEVEVEVEVRVRVRVRGGGGVGVGVGVGMDGEVDEKE